MGILALFACQARAEVCVLKRIRQEIYGEKFCILWGAVAGITVGSLAMFKARGLGAPRPGR